MTVLDSYVHFKISLSAKIITRYSSTKNIFSLSSPVGHSPRRLLSDLTASLSMLERTYLLDHYVVNPEHSSVRRSRRISLNTLNQLLVHLQNESTLGIRNCQDLFSATLFSVLGFNCWVVFFSLELCESYSKLRTFSTVFIHMWGITTTISHVATRGLNPVKINQFYQTFSPLSDAFSHLLLSLKVPAFFSSAACQHW